MRHGGCRKAGSFSASAACGYGEARRSFSHKNIFFASGTPGEKIRGCAKKDEAIYSRRGCKVA